MRADGVEVVRIPVEKRLSSRVPLPANYEDLDPEMQRRWRVNACRQWMLPDATPEDWWSSFVAFDTFYLRSAESGFYDEEPLPYGRHQKEFIESFANNTKMIAVMPRGFAKTTTLCVLMLMVLTTRPRFSVLYITSVDKRGRDNVARIMREWEENKALITDFSGDYGSPGTLRPGRGSSSPWSSREGKARLSNGSMLNAGSVGAATRGARSKMVLFDDPEQDARSSTDMEAARNFIEELIFKILKPVLHGKRTWMVWSGTRISKKHYLTFATLSEEDGGDPRFSRWKRVVYKAAYPTIDNMEEALWPEHKSIEDLREEIEDSGKPFVLSEYFNEPDSGTGLGFWIDEDAQGYELLEYEGESLVRVNPKGWISEYALPRQTDVVIRYKSPKTSATVMMPLREFLARAPVIAAYDWGRSLSRTADYSCVVVGCFGPEGELVPLDVRFGKWTPAERNRNLIDLCRKWEISVLGVEAFSVRDEFYAEIETVLESSLDPRPRIKKVDVHGRDKVDKIRGLQWRFGEEGRTRGYIKIPWYLESQNRHWQMLIHQIRNANFMAPDLGLPHDDGVDTLRMLQDIVGAKPVRFGEGSAKKLSAKERLLSGILYDPIDGTPMLEVVGIENLSADELDLVEALYERNTNERDRQRGKTAPWIRKRASVSGSRFSL